MKFENAEVTRIEMEEEDIITTSDGGCTNPGWKKQQENGCKINGSNHNA